MIGAADDLLMAEDVAKRYHVSLVTVRRWTAERRIPFYRIGRRILFKRDELEGWLEAHRRAMEPAVQGRILKRRPR